MEDESEYETIRQEALSRGHIGRKGIRLRS